MAPSSAPSTAARASHPRANHAAEPVGDGVELLVALARAGSGKLGHGTLERRLRISLLAHAGGAAVGLRLLAFPLPVFDQRDNAWRHVRDRAGLESTDKVRGAGDRLIAPAVRQHRIRTNRKAAAATSIDTVRQTAARVAQLVPVLTEIDMRAIARRQRGRRHMPVEAGLLLQQLAQRLAPVRTATVTIAIEHEQITLFQIDSRQRARMLTPPLRHRVNIGRAERAPLHQRLLVGTARKDCNAGFRQPYRPIAVEVAHAATLKRGRDGNRPGPNGSPWDFVVHVILRRRR